MKCEDCYYCYRVKMFCNKFKQQLQSIEIETDCNRFLPKDSKPKKPKGLQIRDNKRKRNNAKMRKEKPDQESICRFVDFKYKIFGKTNGKTKVIGTRKEFGLQIGNRIYTNDGHYKFANNKNLHIEHIYNDMPEQAGLELAEKYNRIKG